jgi:hypothetical protein
MTDHPMKPEDRALIELKPCAYCGRDDDMTIGCSDHEEPIWYVQCGCTAGVCDQASEANAIAAWNRRPHPEALGEVEDLRTALEDLRIEYGHAQREALELATWLHKNFYSEVTDWKPFTAASSLMTQIDNMVAGLRNRLVKAEASVRRAPAVSAERPGREEPVAWTGSEALAFIRATSNRAGFMWRDRSDAHPIALYAATPPHALEETPADVTRLVLAARAVAFHDDATTEELKELDAASEAFADRVPWEDEPSEAEEGR